MMMKETRRGAFVHVLLCGEVDSYEAAILGDALRKHIETGDTHILLEFGFGVFVSSSLIGILIGLQRLAVACGGEITLVRAPRTLSRSLGVLGVGGFFRMEETIAAAAALSAEARPALLGSRSPST